MDILNHLNLFFNTAVDDCRINNFIYQNIRYITLGLNGFELKPIPFSCTWGDVERKANSLMSESRYWLSGKTIKLHVIRSLFSIEEIRNYTNTIEKIKSVVKAIFLFAVGIMLKSIVWIANPIYIYQRHQRIFELILEQNQFSKQFQFPKFKPITFSTPHIVQDRSPLSQQPDTLNYIIPFLDDKDQTQLARTCKQYCTHIANFISDDIYPSIISKAWGKVFLSKLTPGILSGEFCKWFEDSQEVSTLLDENEQLEVEIMSVLDGALLFDNKELLKKIFKAMGDQSVQYIKDAEGKGLMFRLKEIRPNDPYITDYEQLVILLKRQQKWRLMSFNLKGGLRMFLTDMCYHDDASKLVDYLKRLFKGEPCGSFPDSLNDQLKVNFLSEKASDILVEGPRLCFDGKTPIVQLWPPKQINHQQVNKVT